MNLPEFKSMCECDREDITTSLGNTSVSILYNQSFRCERMFWRRFDKVLLLVVRQTSWEARSRCALVYKQLLAGFSERERELESLEERYIIFYHLLGHRNEGGG
ncbi:unnamed protein product, partial [Timema podura]|nr:unnamed protein product [Timema podura]